MHTYINTSTGAICNFFPFYLLAAPQQLSFYIQHTHIKVFIHTLKYTYIYIYMHIYRHIHKHTGATFYLSTCA